MVQSSICATFLILFALTLFSFISANYNYTDAFLKSILFLRVKDRASYLIINVSVGGVILPYKTVDLVGGYYIAGDNVKYGLPMAFTTTMLAWSFIEFGVYMDSDKSGDARAALRWSTDYLLKVATTTPGVLYVQVGEPNSDHRCWDRPEDMDTPRLVYNVSAQNPGSEVAAETAAALAAASIVFKKDESSYSEILLRTAMNDELMWGAAWIYRASQDDSYMSYIERNCVRFGLTNHDFFFNWDDKRAGTNVLLAINYLGNQVADFQVYKDSSDIYICSMIKETSFATAQFTPGGLLYTQDGSNLQYVTASSFLLLTYAKYLGADGMINSCGNSLISGAVLETHAKKQIDYILGDNPMNMSYMVGFGENYPTRIHHRGSSIPSIYDHPGRISCDDGQQYLTSLPPNPNLLVGAIVGGPDIDDNYEDSRSNSWQAEPATYINAPFVGVAAYLTIYTPK